MFYYHKVIYNSKNSSQINNLLLISRNQILNKYEDFILLKNPPIKKKLIKRKYRIMRNRYSYKDLSLNMLFFHQFILMLILYSHFEIIFIMAFI